MKNNSKIKTLEPPGGILIWIVIFVELMTFGIALIFFLLNGKENQSLYHASALQLNKSLAFVNTIVLLTSGYTMAEAIRFLKKSMMNKFKMYTLSTILLGVLFIVIKFIEYYTKFQHNISFNSNSFFSYYFMLTGFHLLHVIFGLVLLSYFYFSYNKKNEDIEATAAFWHMCDLIWLLIFPVIYLIF
ncbi:MAG: cytochrome c oxidase subunit 3 [Chitinophagaceae bacterium]|nr:cytochrome c oxidase subunit 3 [Chitinophagaceae bacterium]